MKNSDNEPVLEASALGKRYGKAWALRDCTMSLPAGRIVALVGPNGAGKTTLLHLATGLLQPSTGTVRVLGSTPARDAELLSRVSFVAQDVPLYPNFSVRDMLTLGERLNLPWDGPLAKERLERLGIPLGQRVGSLSGGSMARWPWRWHWPSNPRSSCWTSLWPAWIPSPAESSLGC
jgi:ABC-2 type transport system ATP-binding protein